MAPVTRSLAKILPLRDQSAQARINRLPVGIFTAILLFCLPNKFEPYFAFKTLVLCQPAINFWLDHAKEQPFSLCVQSKYGYDKGIYNVRNVYNLFNIIAPFSSRCQELNVKIDSIDHVPFFTWKGGKVPALERLLLQVTNRINEDGFHKGDTIPPITVFDGAPALRAATLGFSSKRLSDPSYFPFPWHQLTHLKIVYRVLPKVSQEFLKQCINLEQASFVIGSLSDTANHLPRHPIITLGRLLSLKIILKEPFETQGLFRDYSFPNLRLFELSVKRTRDIVTVTAVPAGISSESLTSLQLSGAQLSMDTHTISRYFSECPSLQNLVLSLPNIFIRDILSTLAGVVQFLPRLKMLILYTCVSRESDLISDETISACEKLFVAWTKHYFSTDKAMQLLTMYQRAPNLLSPCCQWSSCLQHRQHRHHDNVAKEIEKILHSRLKIDFSLI
ncbi:hypothetical protein J132_04298 [Termitomyces sp. J132]|nr:hypothetical protein J132_04298 [Termitomyces sp. J132]